MKHPVKGDFDTAVNEAGVTVTFKPTNSIYSFHRLADSDDIARIGPVSPQRVRHAGPTGETGDYVSDEDWSDGAANRVRSRRVGLVGSRRGASRHIDDGGPSAGCRR